MNDVSFVVTYGVAIYDNENEFNLHFETLCDSYRIRCKPTSIKNPQVISIRVHALTSCDNAIHC